MDIRLSAAGVGLGASSSTVDLLHTCSRIYNVWKSLSHADDELQVLKAGLLLQQGVFEQWQRDWYSFTIKGKESVSRQRLLREHDETVHATVTAIKRNSKVWSRYANMRQALKR